MMRPILTKEDLCNIVWTYQTDGAIHGQLATAMVQTRCNRSACGAITLTVQSGVETSDQPIKTQRHSMTTTVTSAGDVRHCERN